MRKLTCIDDFRMALGAFLVLGSLFSGCAINMAMIDVSKGESMAIRTEPMIRHYFTLNDESDAKWEVKSDDPDAEVTQERVRAGISKVRIRIHRGFDGPATVNCRLVEEKDRAVRREFNLMFYKDIGDRAFWK